MRCAACGRENADTHRFCIHCGAPLEATQPASGAEPEDPVEALRADVRRLTVEVAELRRVMAEHGLTARPSEPRAGPVRGPDAAPRQTPPSERRRTQSARPTGQPARTTPPTGPRTGPVRAPDAAPEPTPSGEPRTAPVRRPLTTLAGEPQRPAVVDPSAPASGSGQVRGVVSAVDWEIILGGNWLARIGALALIIGVGFFLKLAFDNEWIGEEARIGMGVVGGLALVGGGEYWRRRYPVYAQALAGGGVAIVYLSVFSAYAFYQLIGIYPAIGVLALTSVAAATLAVRHESTSLAILGMVGAYLAPLLIGEFGGQDGTGVAGTGPNYEVMVYVLLVNVGVLALSTLRNWRWFTLLALLASLASFMAWYDYAEDFADIEIAQAFLTGIFLTFVSSTMLYHVLWRRVPQAFDHSMMVLNAVAFLALSYGLLWNDYREWMGLFTLLLAAFYAALGALALLRGREQYYLALMAFGIAVVFLAAAAPVQLEGPWIGTAWATQGAVLIALSFRLGRLPTRIAGLMALVLSILRLLAVDVPTALMEELTAFRNPYALTFATAAAALFIAAYLLRRNRDALRAKEWVEFPAVLAGANVLLAALFATQLDNPWFGAAWAAQGAAFVGLSFLFGGLSSRLIGLTALAAGAAWLLLVGLPMALEEDLTPFANLYALAFGGGAVVSLAAAYALWSKRDSLLGKEWVEFPAVLTGANVLLTTLFATQLDDPWFAAAWAAQGAAFVGLSFVFGGLSSRLIGLAALALGALRLLAVGLPMALDENLTPFVNLYALAFSVGAVVAYAAAYALWLRRDSLRAEEWVEFPAVLMTANVLLAALFATQLGSTWLPVAWSVQASAMLWLSRAWGLREMRWSGVVLLAVVAARLVGWETTIETDGFTPVLNGRMLAFASGIAALYAAVAMLRGRADRLSERERVLLVPALLTGASALTLWILAAEAFALVDSGIIDVSGDAEFYVKSLSLSLVLAVYASAALTVGVLRRLRTVRIASLGLLAVPVVKLFLADSFALEQGYRVAAFMCLGALLLAGGFLYQRYQEAIRGFLFEAEASVRE